MKKITFLLLSVFFILTLVFGCASSANGSQTEAVQPDRAYGESSTAYDSDSKGGPAPTSAPVPMPAEKPATAVDDTSSLMPDPSRKMIWNGDMELETVDFDASVKSLYSLIEECGGYIQSSAVTGEGRNTQGEPRLRNARYTVRIPSDNFQLFMKGSGNVATILYSNTSAQDVTSQYFDVEARLSVLKIKEHRLLEMLKQTEKAEYTDELQYILQLENELSNVRYEIESLTGTLRKYDDLISYSTVTVYLNEVKIYTATPVEPQTIGDRISERFSESIRNIAEASGNLLVWVIGNSPTLILLALIGTAVYFITRAALNRKKKKATLPPPPSKDQM